MPLACAVIVTTPQDIALLDAKTAIEMFQKVHVPILGVIENMAMHQCSSCNYVEHIFAQGSGTRIAETYHTQQLRALPMSITIRE